MRFGFFDRLKIFRARMQEKMHMRVDQARHQGGVAQIDHFGVRGMLHAAAGGRNAFAFDQDFTGTNDLAALHIQQPGGVQNDRMTGARGTGSTLRVRRRGKKRNSQRQHDKAADSHTSHPLVQSPPEIGFILLAMANSLPMLFLGFRS